MAQQGLAEAVARMSPSQIFRAKKMAANCRDRNYKNCD
jgi:hypothetical protein